MERYSKNLRPCLGHLRPYVAGKGYTEISRKYGLGPGNIVKLGSNENPYGPSPGVGEALSRISPERYPEPEELMESLSKYTGFPQEQIVIGAGMDGVMDTISRLFLGPGDLSLIHIPTFSYYEILTRLAGAEAVISKRGPGPEFQVSPDVPPGIKMVFLCSPNNPTGGIISESLISEMAEKTDAIVFLDEAYIDFADRSLADLCRDHENIVIGRTMSKAFGLAGMRLGYAMAPEWIADQYRRAAPPFFGVTCASLAAGVAALSDLEHMRRTVSIIRSERRRLEKATGAHPSHGNFIYTETDEPSAEVAEKMLKCGIIIRDCRSFRGAGDHHIRVTVGTPEQNSRFIEAYQSICK